MFNVFTRFILAACLLITASAGSANAGPAKAEQAAETSRPHAVYPGWSRPPGPGKKYDTWQDAQGPDVGEVTVDPERLPSRVDNATRPQFPPIYRQTFGACGQFAAVASVFTYEMNVLDGTVADTDATRFPAHFSWNMINRAQNKGSEAYHGWEVAKRIGIPTAKTYGGVRLNKIGVWPNGYDVWRDAMDHRVSGYRYTPALTVEQLDEARGWLYDRNQPDVKGEAIGGLFGIDGRMGQGEDRDKVTVTIPKGEYAEGQGLWIAWSATGYGHGMACVGYDDQVGYDRNGDGEITNDKDINDDGKVTLADWERGAWIVVNSWGKKWSGDGKIYLLYSAMVDDTWPRGKYIGRVEVARYQPRVTARIKLACDNRTDLRMTIGIAADPDAKAPEHTIAPEAFNGWPLFGRTHAGYVPLAGPEQPEPIEVGIDLTELLDKVDVDQQAGARVFLTLTRKDGSQAIGQLHEAGVRFYDNQGNFEREIPMDIGEGNFGETELTASITLTPAKEDEQLTLSVGDRRIMSYNAAFVKSPITDAPWYGRSGFIHPVYSPKGKVVTGAFPEDHPHQHGLMFAWTSAEYEGQKVDFWNAQKKQAKIEHVKTVKADKDSIEAKLRHVITAGKHNDVTVLNETWTLTRVEHDALNVFDLVSVQTCATDKPLKLRKHKYGAMCIRGPASWSNGEAMLTSEGKTQTQGNHTRPNWVALFGRADMQGKAIGEYCGIAAMSHPDNLHGPQPVRLHPEMSYFCFAPMILDGFEITPEKPYVSKFRFVAYDGKPDPKQLDAIWEDYAKTNKKLSD